ncbi:MAG TPA: tagaturonate epimerase family protein, partial [Candidatus Eisenbacteria bacterium]|nr:tagaturonate epimerase family protein [Candidatus Eisenbacteria bacterium]
MNATKPIPLGLKKSFGYGDRLGLATPGHLAAHRKFDFAPIFAQQSIREMARTERTPEEVMRAAESALAKAGYSGAWGADADHLKTTQDVDSTAAAGFCFFTIDPSEFVSNQADQMSLVELEAGVAKLEADGIFPDADWRQFYLEQTFEVSEKLALRFTVESLHRAAVKYARAIAHAAMLSHHIQQSFAAQARWSSSFSLQSSRDVDPDKLKLELQPFPPGSGGADNTRTSGVVSYEVEISVDETDSPTSSLEHLFFGLELKRRGVSAVSLAPRFVGEFEKGIDYRGDLARFEASLREHVAIAQFCGPYKISVHSGSDKFSAYPIVGRVCGDLLHVKTAGTSYLEALRVLARTAPKLFAEIAAYCRGRFDTDRKSY